MNLAGMISGVRDRIPEATANQWTDAQITRWLNEGQDQVAHDIVPEALVGDSSVNGLVIYGTASMASNVASVANPGSTLRILGVFVQYGGQTGYAQARQVPVGSVRFDSTSPADLMGSGVSIFSPVWWADRTAINVRPGANLATCALNIVRLARPVALSATSDTSIIPVSLHHIVVEYAAEMAKRMEREYTEAAYIKNKYETEVANVNQQFGGMQGQNQRRAAAIPAEI
jgi:hypothetical protein